MTLGEQVRKAREKKGLTQEKLAHLAETTGASIHRLENGKHNPSLAFVMRLADTLGDLEWKESGKSYLLRKK